eukprot:gene17134-18852_t
MAAMWKNYKNSMKEKRTGNNNKVGDILKKEEVVVQRLSAEVTGKAQKYSRIGPREFVRFEFDEVTTENIKSACRSHFLPMLTGKERYCDILAGEQGPSCRSVDQIPDLKVIHVRFIEEKTNSSVGGADDNDPGSSPLLMPAFKRTERHAKSGNDFMQLSQPLLLPKRKLPVPKSLSVLEMMKLGKEVHLSTELIELYSFELDTLAWSRNPLTVEFKVERDPFGTGGFRNAYKATTCTMLDDTQNWVVKKYLTRAVEILILFFKIMYACFTSLGSTSLNGRTSSHFILKSSSRKSVEVKSKSRKEVAMKAVTPFLNFTFGES